MLCMYLQAAPAWKHKYATFPDGGLKLNPRPAGVWLVPRPAGGGGQRPPWDLPNYWTDFQISNAIR